MSEQLDAFQEGHNFIVPIGYLAECFGVSQKQIRNYVQDGMPQAARGRYDLKECVAWMLDHVKRRQRPETENTSATELNIARKARIDLELKQAMRELIPAGEVAHTLTAVATIVAGQLDGLGPRMAAMLARETEPATIESLLFAECRGIRESIAAELSLLEVADAPVKRRSNGAGRGRAKAKPAQDAAIH